MPGAGFGGVGVHRESGVGDEVEAVVGEADLAYGGVVEVFDAGDVLADVVLCPAGSEVVALCRELADEV